MIVVSTEYVPGREIAEAIGVVKGNTIRAKWIGKDLAAGLRNVVGGELKEYTEMMTESRNQAVNRMIKNAEEMGADAVIGMRFMTSAVTAGAAEMLAYGTAVKLK